MINSDYSTVMKFIKTDDETIIGAYQRWLNFKTLNTNEDIYAAILVNTTLSIKYKREGARGNYKRTPLKIYYQ